MAALTLAHNLSRELTMVTSAPSRGRTDKRAALWVFPRIATVRLIRPQGRLTLSMSANDATRTDIETALEKLEQIS